VFSQKKTPPSREYFKSHVENDPTFKYDTILILLDEKISEFEILGTLRIFYRKMFFENKIVDVGGIGEVAVK
jgi:hypothetical protein